MQEYKDLLTRPLSVRTVAFLVKDDKVLLGLKKKGFGKGNYLGIGGKVESGETPEEGAIREVKEEIQVNIPEDGLIKMGVLRFYFPHMADESWNQEVHVYIVRRWHGDPVETEEIQPVWFDNNNLPLNTTWDDAKYWISKILSGQEVFEEYLFDENLKVSKHQEYLLEQN